MGRDTGVPSRRCGRGKRQGADKHKGDLDVGNPNDINLIWVARTNRTLAVIYYQLLYIYWGIFHVQHIPLT